MLLFLILLIPCAIALYCIEKKDQKLVPIMFIGLMCAVVYSLIRIIFFYSHRITLDSFLMNFLWYYIRLALLPNLVIYSLYCLLTKGSAEFKINSFFPLMAVFYAVFIPYNVVAFTDSIYSGYDCFLKPVLYLAMLVELTICLKKFHAIKKENASGNSTLCIILIILYSIVPPAVDSFYAMNKFFYFSLPLCVLYVLLPFITVCRKSKLLFNSEI